MQRFSKEYRPCIYNVGLDQLVEGCGKKPTPRSSSMGRESSLLVPITRERLLQPSHKQRAYVDCFCVWVASVSNTWIWRLRIPMKLSTVSASFCREQKRGDCPVFVEVLAHPIPSPKPLTYNFTVATTAASDDDMRALYSFTVISAFA